MRGNVKTLRNGCMVVECFSSNNFVKQNKVLTFAPQFCNTEEMNGNSPLQNRN
jgi:hypothetical protein